jgi:uncharacterized protein DUF3106
MKFSRRKWILTLAVCAQQICAVTLFAQNPAGNPIPTNRVPTNTPPPLPPVPVVKSPVAWFRELLAMSPLERKKSLEGRSEENQKRILDKLREYQALSPDERELRLRATELQWYLESLMDMTPTNRAARLAAMSPEDRKLVEYRLQIWDLLPPPLQKELRENELIIPYLTQFESATEEQKEKILAGMSPAQREKLEAGIDRWKKLSAEQRQQKLESFNRIFELTPREKARALNTLSDAERRQIEKTLAAFEKLPPQERVMSIHSFGRFATMSLAERQDFLKNAERWSAMSPNERQAWRNVVAKLQTMPPLPPGLGVPPLPRPPPPLPSGISRPVATNED